MMINVSQSCNRSLDISKRITSLVPDGWEKSLNLLILFVTSECGTSFKGYSLMYTLDIGNSSICLDENWYDANSYFLVSGNTT